MRLRTTADPELAPALRSLPNAAEARRFVPLAPMAALTKDLLLQPGAPSKTSQILDAQVGEYIGYSIPPRWMIAGLLGGFIAMVVGLETWLLRRSGLAAFDWLSSALAIATAAALLWIGASNRHTIPMTAAQVEFVEPIPGTDDVRTQGAVALYNPESSPAVIGSTQGGRLIPDMTGLEGSARRIVWKDIDRWSWDNLALGSGERHGTFVQSVMLPERLEARGTFGPDGLSGQLSTAGIATPGDALIATRLGRIGVELGTDGRFRASAGNVFGQDQYLASGLLSDEQDRRRRIYAQILPEFFREDLSGRPLLFLWGDRRDTGFQFEQDRRLLGASLVAVPLVIERPPASAPIRIPAPLLPFRTTTNPDGSPSSPLWDHRRQQWTESSRPASAWLRFQLPVELLPVDLNHARLVITVSGPVGRVEISALRRNQNPEAAAANSRDEVVSVKTWEAPVGTLSPAEIVESDLLQLDREGGLVLRLAAGEAAPADAAASPALQSSRLSAWRIEQLSLEVSGTIAP
jgi:hypothetical protein